MNRSEGRLVTLVAAGLVCAAAIYTSIVGLKSEHCVIPIGYNIKSVPAHLSEGSTQHVPEKIKSIIEMNDLNTITVAIMEVPCCYGMYNAVEQALGESGKRITLKKAVVGIDGSIKE